MTAIEDEMLNRSHSIQFQLSDIKHYRFARRAFTSTVKLHFWRQYEVALKKSKAAQGRNQRRGTVN